MHLKKNIALAHCNRSYQQSRDHPDERLRHLEASKFEVIVFLCSTPNS